MVITGGNSSGRSKPVLLITGASGFLGQALCRLAIRDHVVYGQFNNHRVNLPGVKPVRAGLHQGGLLSLVRRLKPDAVIHTAAQSQVATCEADEGGTRVINVDVPVRLAEVCAAFGIDFVFTSTDLVFDGRQAPYREAAPTGPVCAYARQKVAAEQGVRSAYPDALICRLPLMFGFSSGALPHFSLQMLAAIQSGQSLALFVDEHRTPVDVESAASGILTVLGRASGLLHLGGRMRVSRYQLGQMMAQGLNQPADCIRPVTIASRKLAIKRAPDCSLVSDRAYRLGYAPRDLDAAIHRTVQQYLASVQK